MVGLKSVPVGWEAMNSFLTQQYLYRHELWLGATVRIVFGAQSQTRTVWGSCQPSTFIMLMSPLF